MQRCATSLLLCVILLAVLAPAQVGPVPQSQHVWIITEENHSYEDVFGNPDMPYFNSLANTYGLASQYYSTQHNSLSALMWFVAGEEVTSNDNNTSCFDVDNVVRHLLAQNFTWKAYEEDLPYAGFMGLSYANYVRRHNPLINFTDVCNTDQQYNSVPFSQLALDMQNNATPNYVYITPNLQHDAHDGTLALADQWLSQQVPSILGRPEFQPGGDGILFIVWDEGDLDKNGNPDNRCSANISAGCGGRIATLVVGPQVRPGLQSETLYSHPNLLSTVCAVMGLSSCPGAGSLAGSMSDFFNTVSISTPFPNAQVTSPVQITAAANNDSSVYSMQIYVDNQLQYHTKGNSVNTALAMSPGQHFVVVQSWDVAGGIHKRGIYVTVQPAAVVMATPPPNAVVASPVPLTATAGVSSPMGSGVNLMQVFVDSIFEYETQGSKLNVKLPMSTGNHTVLVKALNNAAGSGGGGLAQTSFPVTVATPAVDIQSPTANYSGYSPLSLLATTIDPSPVYSVQALVDNNLVYQYTGNGIQAMVNITAGEHTVLVQATDMAGGVYTDSVSVNITPIIVTIATPAANAVVSSPVQIQASVPSNAPVTTMQVYVDSKLQYSTNGTTVNTSLSMGQGSHYLVVQAWDIGGGTWKTGENITVQGNSNGGVTITSPTNGAVVSSPVHFVASASAPNCSNGIDSMQIYPTPGWDDYSVHAAQINTNLPLASGSYPDVVVQAWDKCGNVYKSNVSITVQ